MKVKEYAKIYILVYCLNIDHSHLYNLIEPLLLLH